MGATADKLYGRRGGRWVDGKTGPTMAQLRQASGDAWPTSSHAADPFHPDQLGRSTTRDRHRPRLAAMGLAGDSLRIALDDVPTDPADIAAEWEGRARMASARRGAGLELDPIDLEALRRHPTPAMTQPRKAPPCPPTEPSPPGPAAAGSSSPTPPSPSSSSPPSSPAPASSAPSSAGSSSSAPPPSPASSSSAATSAPADAAESSSTASAAPPPAPPTRPAIPRPDEAPSAPASPSPTTAGADSALAGLLAELATVDNPVAEFVHIMIATNTEGGKRLTVTGCGLTIETKRNDPPPPNITAWGSLPTCPTCLARRHPPHPGATP